MQSNITKAAIQAIQEGNISQLRALKSMIGSDARIPVYYQVSGRIELYSHSGQLVKGQDFEVSAMDNLLPLVSRVIITFSSYSEMQKVFEGENQVSN